MLISGEVRQHVIGHGKGRARSPALAHCKRERNVKCRPSSCGPSPLSLTMCPAPRPPSPYVLSWPRLPRLGIEGAEDVSF